MSDNLLDRAGVLFFALTFSDLRVHAGLVLDGALFPVGWIIAAMGPWRWVKGGRVDANGSPGTSFRICWVMLFTFNTLEALCFRGSSSLHLSEVDRSSAEQNIGGLSRRT